MKNRDLGMGAISKILFDSEDFIWFAGDGGVRRFDGYDMPLITNGELIDVYDIFEDKQGFLWIATTLGVHKYDRQLQTYFSFTTTSEGNTKIAHNFTTSITYSPTGEIIVGSLNGINVIDPITNHVDHILPNPDNDKALQDPFVWQLLTDENIIWVGTDKGLHRLDWNSKEFELYQHDPNNKNTISSNSVRQMVKSYDGTLWVGTFNGLNRFNRNTESFTRYMHDEKDPTTISGNTVWAVYEDSQQMLWVGVDQGGLNLFHRGRQDFIRFGFDSTTESSLVSSTVRSIAEDSSGDLWIGHFPTGVSFFDRSTVITQKYTHAPPKNSLSHASVLSISEDKKGNLWIGTDGGGLNHYNPKKNHFSHYLNNVNDKNSISKNAVLATYFDSNDELWLGMWGGGINKYDAKNKQFIRYPINVDDGTGTNNANIWNIIEDHNGTFWLATQGGGLNSFDPISGKFEYYKKDRSNPFALQDNSVWTLLEDNTQTLWVGTNGGLSVLDRRTKKFKTYLAGKPGTISNNSILDIHQDQQGNLWFGTRLGLNLYDPTTDTFKAFTKQHGFEDHIIRSIIDDDNGDLWVGTNKGISRFNPSTYEITNFGRNNSWQTGEFNTQSVTKTANGKLIFGGVNGFTLFNPSEIKPNSKQPKITLTNLKVFTEDILPGGELGILSHAINYTDKLVLDYTQNMFSLSFAALNYRDTQKNNYVYKLEGFDNEWRHIGNQRSATFTNLDSGKYTFKVKGTNNDGVWSKNIASIDIIQLPPPWRTWWAYCIYCVMSLSLAARFIYLQHKKRRQIEEQNRILELKVAERTAELSEKNKDIQSMLNNMRQGLFTINKDGDIHHEYSKYLEQVFERQDISGLNAMRLLFNNSNLQADELDQIEVALKTMIGENSLNFTFNAHLLPKEYSLNIAEKVKIISLDWNPIEAGEKLEKVMVSVRDISRLKEVEKEAEDQRRELDIVGQLLKANNRQIESAKKSVDVYLQANYDELTKNTPPSIELLFRNMHTIKGNARTLGFRHLSDAAHKAESNYNELIHKKNPNISNAQLLKDLDHVRDVFHEYQMTHEHVLGRSNSPDVSENESKYKHFYDKTRAYLNTFKSNDKGYDYIKPINTIMNEALSINLEEVLADLIKSLPTIAKDLNKPSPKLIFSCQEILFKENIVSVLNDVFTHILRNSIDHGIESKDERLAADKPSFGTIQIKYKVTENNLTLIVSDDGKGLNLDALYEKGIKTQKWKDDEKPSKQIVAETIFDSGISTKQNVTDLSGRGVGMDAVRHFLRDNGCDIQLNLLDTQSNTFGYEPFEIFITLPPEHYTLKS